jgi:DNA-binding transcriptional LysR family regulator
MDLAAVTLLVEIIDAGNLSQAARKLKMTRANVSYHLSQLERAVGVQLIRRTTRRVEPTEIGLRLYQHGRTIQNELRAAQETVSMLGQSLQGRVRLSVPSGYGQMVMSDWLIDFKHLYPGIVLDVLFENRVADLMREEVDIAVRVMPEPSEALVARELGAVRYIVCASRGYAQDKGLPTELEHLKTAPLITAAVIGRQLRVSAYRGNERHEVALEPTLISEHFPFLRQAIMAGLGVGLVPDYVVQDGIANGEIVAALDDYRFSIFGTQLFMIYMPNRYQTLAARTLIDFILARALSAKADSALTDPFP